MPDLITFIDAFVGTCPPGCEPLRYIMALAMGFVVLYSLIWAISMAQQLLLIRK